MPASADALPRVDLISKAITALEAKLGAPQQYFEINATSHLVNLFVALNDGKVVQPWVYLDGELSSTAIWNGMNAMHPRAAVRR